MLETFKQLRKKHSRFIFESFDIAKNKSTIGIQYLFKLEPDILFRPKVFVPYGGHISRDAVEVFAFNLGLVEAISYWKVACPREFVVRSGFLTVGQIGWWRDLFIRGLGEFFYENRIDFAMRNFLKIKVESKSDFKKQVSKKIDADLILVGGGGDSAVTLELLKNLNKQKKVLLLNPTKASFELVRCAGYKNPLIVRREIDPKLLELNKEGYLNGHTPFSAYLAFLGTLVAALENCQNVIVSNERSADEGNVRYRGIDVNHQYSKSRRFERLFRNYCKKYLSSDINYFSFLRPIYELQVSRIFAKFSKYFGAFKSCNVGQAQNIWCGNCAKCAFSYLSLLPFVSRKQLINIFGADYFGNMRLAHYFKNLTGVYGTKPFECVGTVAESRLAVKLAIEQFTKNGLAIPEILGGLKKKIEGSKIYTKVLNSWSNSNYLPPTYESILREEVN